MEGLIMKKISRIARPGDMVFITQVTKQRKTFFADEKNIKTLFRTLCEVQCIKKCNIFSFVIMPDHIHLIMRSDNFIPNDVLHSLKRNFSLNWKNENEGSIYTDPAHFWQRRHYEHVIWSNREFVGYIHYIYHNPVKHGYVEAPDDWPYSSFHDYGLHTDLGIHMAEFST
jgi:putative transposase